MFCTNKGTCNIKLSIYVELTKTNFSFYMTEMIRTCFWTYVNIRTFSLSLVMSRSWTLALRSPSPRLFAAFLRLKSSFLAAMSRSVRRRVSADWLTVLGRVVVDSFARRSASRDLLWELRMLSYAPGMNKKKPHEPFLCVGLKRCWATLPPFWLTEEVGVFEDVQLVMQLLRGQVQLFGLPLQSAQLLAGLRVAVLN